MLVKDLVVNCYDDIVIYTSDDVCVNFNDLFKGKKQSIPNELLNQEVFSFGAKSKGVIDICVML